MSRNLPKVFSLLALLFISSTAFAKDGGVYAPPPPPDSAFVREIGSLVGAYVAKPPKGELKTGVRYSVVGGRVLAEPAYDKKLKAQIVLINLGDKPAALKSGASTVAEAAPGALSARAVNAVEAGFTVYADGEKISDIAPRGLERGMSYAIVIRDGKVVFGASESP